MRKAKITRETRETRITVELLLDGTGKSKLDSGVPFLDHMLDLFARHGLFDLAVTAKGDLEIDAHHTVEDMGICLGKALLEAVGTPEGLCRYGFAVVPMDEALAEVAVDFSGRPFLVFEADFATERVGEFDVELVEEFFRALAVNSRTTMHIELRRGKNTHHGIEAIFKAAGRALRAAVTLDPRVQGVPSTKGSIDK